MTRRLFKALTNAFINSIAPYKIEMTSHDHRKHIITTEHLPGPKSLVTKSGKKQGGHFQLKITLQKVKLTKHMNWHTRTRFLAKIF